MELDDDTRIRIEALQGALKLAMSSNLPRQDVVKAAGEFHAFLTGKGSPVDVTAQSYRLVPDSDNPRSADLF